MIYAGANKSRLIGGEGGLLKTLNGDGNSEMLSQGLSRPLKELDGL